MKTLINSTNRELAEALARPTASDRGCREVVAEIITQVRTFGDDALINFNKSYDGDESGKLEVSQNEMEAAADATSTTIKEAVALAMANITKFHREQIPANVEVETTPGISCSLRYFPLERVGLYIPGGTAPLLSTIMMLAIPATVAGCREIIICTPPNPTAELLYVASLFNARVFTVGGAQAIAALAYGTKTIPAVNKIFGPGNRYVTEAKMQVSATGVAIDMPAGPSEVLVIADQTADPRFIAADLLSQAEHGNDSQVVFITNSPAILEETKAEIALQLAALPRKEFAKNSLENSTAILVSSLSEAMNISNGYAPEHLILAVSEPEKLADAVENAGSVFLGHYSPESAGDYSSGTNHTLPTSGFARGWSGVSTLSFMKTITFQQLNQRGLMAISDATATLARAEGLEGHARAIEVRTQQ